jgi:bifunctional polynucleotide phosphatase/kinase
MSTENNILIIKPKDSTQPSSHSQSLKLLGFDFDSTLVCQKSSKKFASEPDDWIPLYPTVKDTLNKYYNDGWTIVIFTNQGGVEKKKITLQSLTQRLNNFINYSGIPIYAFAAIKYDNHRKPHTGMWNKAIEILGQPTQAVYIGDAAGRIKGWDSKDKKRKDFSCSDRKFAHNIGIPFQTPEQFFLKLQPSDKWEWGGFDPAEFNDIYNRGNKTKEMIILVGPPASGKSTIAKKLSNHTRINRDTLKTKAKCLSACKKAIANEENIIIDNTNPDTLAREPYITLAKKADYNIVCFVLSISKDLALHMNNVRVAMTEGKAKTIPTLVYNIFYKKFRESPPKKEEGIDEIITIDWKPEFETEKHKNIFYRRY